MFEGLEYSSVVTSEGDRVYLMPSLQFAKLHHVEPNGKHIFVSAAGTLLCPHGEVSSTIGSYLSDEQRARDRGETSPPRGGMGTRGGTVCDCLNTDGLNVAKDENARGFTPPASLFDFLCTADTREILSRGHPARQLPIAACPDTFISEYGKLLCPHGHSKRAAKKRCGCCVAPLPYRRANVGLKLGRFMGVYGNPKPSPTQPFAERAFVS